MMIENMNFSQLGVFIDKVAGDSSVKLGGGGG